MGAAILGPLKSQFTYSQIFFVFSLILLIVVAILSRIRLEAHLASLEALDVHHPQSGDPSQGS